MRTGRKWMSKIDFSGLKLKLLSSIVAISAIQVLKAFMNLKNMSDRDLLWYAAIHMVFVISGLFMAWTDRISGEAHAGKSEGKSDGKKTGKDEYRTRRRAVERAASGILTRRRPATI